MICGQQQTDLQTQAKIMMYVCNSEQEDASAWMRTAHEMSSIAYGMDKYKLKHATVHKQQLRCSAAAKVHSSSNMCNSVTNNSITAVVQEKLDDLRTASADLRTAVNYQTADLDVCAEITTDLVIVTAAANLDLWIKITALL
ncbi:hypothetical protein QVD17_11937 [Tagetes erecta]|uniref:Uncharacterized protein n=1 Tax=Tagetes erecta TaxID=13708 RepID=A0AAD8NVE7_TARER|nr:hypothetical protein QVD17_11937 [Tagetes erecta]